MTVSAITAFCFLFALRERFPYRGILEVEVVVELIRVHERGYRDPVLHENKVLTLLVQAPYQPAKVAADLGNGEVVNQGGCRAAHDRLLVK